MEHLPALQLPVLRLMAEKLTIRDLVAYALSSELHQVRIIPHLPYLVKYVKADGLEHLFECISRYHSLVRCHNCKHDKSSTPFELSFLHGILQNENVKITLNRFMLAIIISENNIPLLQFLFNHYDLNLLDYDEDWAPFEMDARTPEMLQILFDNGISPTAKGLLHHIYFGRTKLFNVYIRDKRTPITEEVIKAAIKEGYTNLVKAIIQMGEIEPFYLGKAIFTAGRHNKPEILKLLLKQLDAVDYKDTHIQDILKNGFMVYSIDLDKPNEKLWDMVLPYIVDKKDLFKKAVDKGNTDVLEYLIKKGITAKVGPNAIRWLPKAAPRYNAVKTHKILEKHGLLK